MTLSRMLLVVGSGGVFTGPPTPVTTREALYNGTSSEVASYQIGAATYNGSDWTVYGSNPVLAPGSGGTWDDAHVKDPCLLHTGSQYVMYYAGHDGTTWKIGRATASSLTGTWTKYGSNPVLSPGAGPAFDDTGVMFPVVLYEPTDTGKEWKMWYGADDGSGTTQTVGYAHSTDGLSWTKVGEVIGLGSGGSWNDVGMLPGAIYKDGSTYYLFANGRQGTTNPRWQGGLWTFTNPEGTYTADAGNPILLARFNTVGTSRQLTANTPTGTTTVRVASTALWNLNEPMAIGDTTSDTDIRSIASIDSSTQITLDAATSTGYAVADGATIRPFTFNSVFFRTVREAAAGGYEAFITPFQPVEDLSVGGTKLREGSMRATASSLAGPWSYDYTTGLMFPLQDGGWDNISSENPSVIATP